MQRLQGVWTQGAREKARAAGVQPETLGKHCQHASSVPMNTSPGCQAGEGGLRQWGHEEGLKWGNMIPALEQYLVCSRSSLYIYQINKQETDWQPCWSWEAKKWVETGKPVRKLWFPRLLRVWTKALKMEIAKIEWITGRLNKVPGSHQIPPTGRCVGYQCLVSCAALHKPLIIPLLRVNLKLEN